jgi:hypothetical protein
LILHIKSLAGRLGCEMPLYRLHDHTGDDLGTIEHAAGSVEPGDIVFLTDGREALVTARVETEAGSLAALFEVVVASSPRDSDDALP